MDIFGIGPLELFFIILLVIIIFGPRDIAKASKAVGAWLRKVVQSDVWKFVNQASHKIRTLPNDLMREVGADEIQQAIAPLQSDLKKIQTAARKPASSLLSESWIAEPGSSDRQPSTASPAGESSPLPTPREKPEE